MFFFGSQYVCICVHILTYIYHKYNTQHTYVYILFNMYNTHTETERQTDRQTDRQTFTYTTFPE